MSISNLEVWSVIDDIEKILNATDCDDAINGYVYTFVTPVRRDFARLNRGYTPEQIKFIQKFKDSTHD